MQQRWGDSSNRSSGPLVSTSEFLDNARVITRPSTGRSRTVYELEQENRELRLKYARALKLLSQYKCQTERQLGMPRRDFSQPDSPVERAAPPDSPVMNKRSLLMRYLAIQNNRSSIKSESPVSIRSPQKSLARTWREKLLKHNDEDDFLPPDFKPACPEKDLFDLAESLNSGDIQLNGFQPQEPEQPVEEISHLLSKAPRLPIPARRPNVFRN